MRQVAAPPDGARTVAPEVELREWANPATGEVRRVATGIDPGWDYHVGGQRTLGVNAAWLRRCERTVETRGAAAASRMIDRHLAGPGFRWFLERPRATPAKARWEARPDLIEAAPVAILPSAVAIEMGTATPVVRLTEKVMHKQALHHAEFRAEHYALIPEVLAATPSRGKDEESGQRWVFDRVVAKRRIRVVVEVPRFDHRPLVVSAYRREK